MNGIELINKTFADAKADGRAAFLPYFAVGFPDMETSIDIMEGFAKAGVDGIEVGVPFSDPLADGPTIQHATQISLKNGTTLPDCLEAIRELRKRRVEIPLMLMSYANPLMAYGYEKLVADATEAGASGFIIPDLPVDEAASMQALIESHGAAFAHFLAPTSNEARMKMVAETARGFIYLVAVTGVTGARDETVPDELKKFIGNVRKHAKQPLVVGFGIGSPEKAVAIGEIADGVIIGSKLISLAEDEGKDAVVNFAIEVRIALG